MKHLSAREHAFLALRSYWREGQYLVRWFEKAGDFFVHDQDIALAREIAYGVVRRKKSLDYLIEQLLDEGHTLKVKLKEKIILRMALYQYYFMDRVPLYALVDEAVSLARKYCHSIFVKFVNALLRKLEGKVLSLPSDDLSVNLSYPKFFVEQLIEDYGVETAKAIMAQGNNPGVTMVRLLDESKSLSEEVAFQTEEKDVFVVRDRLALGASLAPRDYYIQNIASVKLLRFLARGVEMPQRVLDLCASPGGKTLLLKGLFPEAKYYANDINGNKLSRLKENFERYGVEAALNMGRGEDFVFDDEFDIIVLDVPCSNSGVLNRRPEARWRIDKEHLSTLETEQLSLIGHAVKGLSFRGQLWYMTCSILKRENERVVAEACHKYGLRVCGEMKTLLPNEKGCDGGFACALVRS